MTSEKLFRRVGTLQAQAQAQFQAQFQAQSEAMKAALVGMTNFARSVHSNTDLPTGRKGIAGRIITSRVVRSSIKGVVYVSPRRT